MRVCFPTHQFPYSKRKRPPPPPPLTPTPRLIRLDPFTALKQNYFDRVASREGFSDCIDVCFFFFFFFFFFFLIWVLRSLQEYFTYIEPIVHQRWARKPENPGKNHLTIRKQNLAFLHVTLARLEPQR